MNAAPGPEDLPLFQASGDRAAAAAIAAAPAPRRKRAKRPKRPIGQLIIFPLYRRWSLVDQIRRELFPPIEERVPGVHPEARQRAAFDREVSAMRAIGLSKQDAREEVDLLMEAAARLAFRVNERRDTGHT